MSSRNVHQKYEFHKKQIQIYFKCFLRKGNLFLTYYQEKNKELRPKIIKEANGGQKDSNPHIIHNLSIKIYVA